MTIPKGIARPLGRPISDKDLRPDLERYRELVLELGAADAVIIPTTEVPIDERVRLKCMVPGVGGQGKRLIAPLMLQI